MKLLADSTFYICFIDCISEQEVLKEIIKYFDCILTPVVHKELSSPKYKTDIKGFIDENKIFIPGLNLGEALTPFFSKAEVKKGEHEIITLAYVLHNFKEDFYFILDEGKKRRFVENNFNYLIKYLVGTIGFIPICYKQKIVSKEKAIDILNKIQNSDFFSTKELIKNALDKIV
jgi:predicted nucleic acid-binding protein